jgi:predicted AAA+ superfamily ATPase
VIDEVQKVPALLNVVHYLIENTDKLFVLTGSSARKLKQTGVNLLAGRAFVKHLHPFSFLELGEAFSLDQALQFGLLPKVSEFDDVAERVDFLRAYTHTYLKEEIWAEHFVRKLEPFQRFLEVAAQCNGQSMNLAKMSRDVGVDAKSIRQYFSILEDTLIGFQLPAFSHSFRKTLLHAPKFYFFDVGVVRALNRTLEISIQEATYDYGLAFEHFIVVECIKLASYFYPDYRFYHLRAKSGLEVDLVVDRPGAPLLMIEIKSATEVRPDHLRHLDEVAGSLGSQAECYCLSRVARALQYEHVRVYPWQQGIQALFVKPSK